MSGYLDRVSDVSLRWTASCQHLTTRLGTQCLYNIVSHFAYVFCLFLNSDLWGQRVFSVLLTETKLAPSRYSVSIWWMNKWVNYLLWPPSGYFKTQWKAGSFSEKSSLTTQISSDFATQRWEWVGLASPAANHVFSALICLDSVSHIRITAYISTKFRFPSTTLK